MPRQHPALAEDLGAIFTILNVPRLSGAQTGEGGEWVCQGSGYSTRLGSQGARTAELLGTGQVESVQESRC